MATYTPCTSYYFQAKVLEVARFKWPVEIEMQALSKQSVLHYSS